MIWWLVYSPDVTLIQLECFSHSATNVKWCVMWTVNLNFTCDLITCVSPWHNCNWPAVKYGGLTVISCMYNLTVWHDIALSTGNGPRLVHHRATLLLCRRPVYATLAWRFLHGSRHSAWWVKVSISRGPPSPTIVSYSPYGSPLATPQPPPWIKGFAEYVPMAVLWGAIFSMM